MDWIQDPAPQSFMGIGLHSRRISTSKSRVRSLPAPPSIFTQLPIPQCSPACCWPPNAPSTTTSPQFSAPVTESVNKISVHREINFGQRSGHKPPRKDKPPLSPPV